MDKSPLVETQLRDGVVLIREADAAGLGLTSSFWHYYEDTGQWRLVLASPRLDATLAKNVTDAYARFVDVIRKSNINAISIADLKIVSTRDPLVAALAMLFRTPPDAVVSLHATDTFINGIHLAEVYVYRSAPPIVSQPATTATK